MLDMINSMPVRVSHFLCERRFLRFAKSNRRARINRKWHKKYGVVYTECPGKAWQMGDTLYACPHVAAALQKGCK